LITIPSIRLYLDANPDVSIQGEGLVVGAWLGGSPPPPCDGRFAVSDTAQGPGWWQASDGKWYPPEQHPNYAPPPPPNYAPPRPPAYAASPSSTQTLPPTVYVQVESTHTNGLAIASFVLSLLWFFGLTSLLAIIFAISARRSIKRSQGRQTGDGFAIAGLIVGLLGILGTALLIAIFVAANHGLHQVDKAIQQATTPRVVAIGQTVNVTADEAGTTSGIRTVTVYSVTYPAGDANGQPDSTPGKQYAAADIQVCAGASGSQNGPDGFLFSLLFQDGQSSGVAFPLNPKQPDLGSFDSIPANGCVRGFLLFEIANGTRPTKAQYGLDPFHNYQWTLP